MIFFIFFLNFSFTLLFLIIQDIMTVVLLQKPKRPLEFIAECLQVIQTKTDAGHAFNVLELVRDLASKSPNAKPASSKAVKKEGCFRLTFFIL